MKFLPVLFLILLVFSSLPTAIGENIGANIHTYSKDNNNTNTSLYIVSGSYDLKDDNSGTGLGKVYYQIGVPGGTYVLTSKTFLTFYYAAELSGFKKEVGYDSSTGRGWKYESLDLKVELEGPDNDVGVSWQDPYTLSTAMWWTGNTGHFSIHSRDQPFGKVFGSVYGMNDLQQGVYFWKITISFTYHFSSEHNSKDVTLQHTIVVVFSDLVILHFNESGDWESEIGAGANTAFSMMGAVWSTVGTKISQLDWGGKLLHLDFLGLLKNIVTMMGVIGYGLFEMFIMPITAISYIMAYSTDTNATIFFLIMVVAVVLIMVMFLIAIWKIILIIKP